jgi:hypothetical protein
VTTVSGDETFERFRRKLGDETLRAINSGKHIGNHKHCPLGCVSFRVTNNARPSHPTVSFLLNAPGVPAEILAPTEVELRQFAMGFDDGGAYAGSVPPHGPYFELGKLYRARFP